MIYMTDCISTINAIRHVFGEMRIEVIVVVLVIDRPSGPAPKPPEYNAVGPTRCELELHGRVRAGYLSGEVPFGSIGDKASRRALLHLVGDRPGSEHHSFLLYLSAPAVETWSHTGKLDHDDSKVVANIADSALAPDVVEVETLRVLKSLSG